jgi:LuxR family maltose regulon positive regulatory protein
MPETLLRLTKVRPPARRSDAVRRPRLVDALLENSDRKLLLLIAPAGYGKTTLLVDFAGESPIPIAWLTLDAGDRDPRSFIEYVVRALQECSSSIGATTLAALSATVEVEQRVAELARILAADAGHHLTGMCILALDDFHEVNESPAVTAFLDELLRVLPDNLRILLAGRTLPNLTVSRLVVEHNLFGFSETDLRFGPEEVAELVRVRYHTELDPDQARSLTDRAEGWIAGLLLSIHGLLDGALGSLARSGGEFGPLYDYLADEAYDRQEPEMRRFLLASSTLRVLTDAACTAVLGNGNWMARLADVEKANLFVTQLGGPLPAFRYHPLFREFLQGRLRREQPDLFRGLHRRAGRFLATQEDWPGAIEHFHEAGAAIEAARIVAQIAPRLEQEGRWYLLAQTIDQLPEELRAHNATLLVSRARAAALTGDLKAAEVMARQAIAAARDGQTSAWAQQVLGNALRRLGRTEEAIATLDAVLAHAASDEALVATVRRDLAGCYGVRGDFPAAATEYRAAYDYFAREGNTYEAARAAYGVGASLARMGQADEACVHYGEALTRWRDAHDLGNVAAVLNNVGYIRTLQGEYDEARTLFEEGLGHARAAGHRVVEANLHDSLGTLLLYQGDLHTAVQTFQQGLEIARDTSDLWTTTAMMEGVGLTALLQGDGPTAASWFDRGMTLAERQQSTYRCTQLSTDRALVRLHFGDAGGAVHILQEAVRSFEQANARRDVIRARLWLAHALYRGGTVEAAGEAFQQAAAEAVSLNVAALLDLPARWDPEAFEAIPAGDYAALRATVLRRVRRVRPASRPRLVESQALPVYHAYSFGRARLTGADGAPIDWSRDKARELFFYLLHYGAVKSQRIVADLWPNASPSQGKASLYQAVYALRRATFPQAVIADDRTYGLRPDLVEYHDMSEFERLSAQLRAESDDGKRIAVMEDLSALHSGPLLDDIDGEWAAQLRQIYEVRYLDLLESLVAAYAEQQAWSRCLHTAILGFNADPDSEIFYQYAADAYRALGKPWAAARVARRARLNAPRDPSRTH